MIGRFYPGFAAKAIMTTAALSGAHGIASAQATEAPTDSDIVVEAPRPIPSPVLPVPLPNSDERSPYSGAPILVTTVRVPVFYSDLDLNNPADAARLMARIDRVAEDTCHYMDLLYPLISDPECATKSVIKTKAAAKEVIAAAAR